MISKDQFLALIESIVAEAAPSEELAFMVAGPQIADALYANGEIDVKTSSRPGEFQFMSEATQVLQFVALMAGTFNAVQKLIETVRSSSDKPSKEATAPVWASQLQQSGIPEKMAQQVAEAFAGKLKEIIDRT